MDDPPQGQEHLGVGRVAEPAAALHARLGQGAAAAVDDHRGADGERLQDDVAERLGEQRRHDDGPRPVEEAGERLAREQPLELDVRQPLGQARGACPS